MGTRLHGLCLLLALAVALSAAGAASRPALLEAHSHPGDAGDIRPGELLVELHEPERVHALARRVGAAVDSPAGGRIQRLRVPAGEERARAAAMRGDSAVRAAAPNFTRRAQTEPNDLLYAGQWGLPRIDMPSAWDVTLGDESITIAVLDSGADPDHPDLAGKLLPGANTLGVDPPPPGTSTCPPSTNTRDDYPAGHGTHVTGTAAAATNNGQGIAGVAWRPKVIPVKVLDCTGNATDLQVIAGIDWAVANGARIVNLSVGGPGQSDVLDAAVARAFMAGAVVIAAAGNGGTDVPYYPAASPYALAVGATDPFDQPASFSNRGSYIAVVAPGVSILSTVPGANYQYKSGTSMASPHVAGLAALILTMHPSWPPSRVGGAIRASADKVEVCPVGVLACPYDQNGRNQWHGSGRINAASAVRMAQVATLPVIPRGPMVP